MRVGRFTDSLQPRNLAEIMNINIESTVKILRRRAAESKHFEEMAVLCSDVTGELCPVSRNSTSQEEGREEFKTIHF